MGGVKEFLADVVATNKTYADACREMQKAGLGGDSPILKAMWNEEHPTNPTQFRDLICDACGGQGWLDVNNDVHGQRIERCDACDKFASDDEAQAFVFQEIRKNQKLRDSIQMNRNSALKKKKKQ